MSESKDEKKRPDVERMKPRVIHESKNPPPFRSGGKSEKKLN